MAKKIRNVKLKSEDIQKNSGKNISHTISKIKEHERFYTTILVLVFMIVISFSIYLGLRVDPDMIYANTIEEGSGFSYTSRGVYLNQKNIGSRDNPYSVTISNITDQNINYILRMIPDEELIEECNCREQLISYDKIKYSLEDKQERVFSNEEMVLTTGFIHPLDTEEIKLNIWLSEDLNPKEEIHFYGKIVLEKIEDMNRED